ncbi:hypothetical protein SRHO_G00160350 [Serrasalmus rhombeus]
MFLHGEVSILSELKKKQHSLEWSERWSQRGRPAATRIGVFSSSHPYKAVVEHASGAVCIPGSMFGRWEGAEEQDRSYIRAPQASQGHTITKWLNPRPSTVR